LIGDANGLPIGGWTVPTNNCGGRPCGGGGGSSNGNRPLGSDGGGLPRGGDSGLSRDQNPRSYAIRPTGPWIRPT
jgi:hypothetical protein